MAQSEVIDLTVSSPPAPTPVFIDLSSEPTSRTRTPKKSNRRKSRRSSPVTREANSGKQTDRPANDKRKNKTNDDEGPPRKCISSKNGRISPESTPPNKNDDQTKPSAIQRRSPSIAPADLFFVDLGPDPNARTENPTSDVTSGVSAALEPPKPTKDDKLLLPSHVSVFGDTAVEILPSTSTKLEDEDYIEYLDYDDTRGIVRYFEEPKEVDGISKKIVCKNCGEEGNHYTSKCTVKICLTCGARDEHSTWSCPISKVCFGCGMKGHVIQACPNPRRGPSNLGDYCNRCYGDDHRSNECPTLWRIYEYVTDSQRKGILLEREGKRNLKIGEGGEGYIADDEWCYNCGDCGHLGDDCTDYPFVSNHSGSSSAFGKRNTMSGPFFDPANVPPDNSRRPRELRDWERDGASIPEGWGRNAPDNVGRRGKKKESDRMARRMREQEDEEDDPDDWFGGSRNVKNRSDPKPRNGAGKGGSAQSGPSGKKPGISISTSFGSGRRDDPPLPSRPPKGPAYKPPSTSGYRQEPRKGNLLSRIDLDEDDRSSRSGRDERRSSGSKHRDYRDEYHASKSSRRHDDSSRSSRRYAERRDGREQRGPRYNGGYTR